MAEEIPGLDQAPSRARWADRVGAGDRRADPPRPGALVRRLAAGAGAAHRPAGRAGHVHPAQPGPAAGQFRRLLRPLGCGPGGGPHVHLLGAGGGRGPDQQLDRPGTDARHLRRPVRGLHDRPDHVRGPVLHGPARLADLPAGGGDHRLGVRGSLDADHDPDGHGGPGAARRGRVLRPGRSLGRRAAGPGAGRRGVAMQPRQVHLPLPRDPGDLVVRVGVRRERAAGQEMLRAADRLGDGP